MLNHKINNGNSLQNFQRFNVKTVHDLVYKHINIEYFFLQAKVNMMWVTNLSFGCLGLIGALVTFLLPETANMPLANTLGDIDNMHRPTADTAEPEINQPRDIAV